MLSIWSLLLLMIYSKNLGVISLKYFIANHKSNFTNIDINIPDVDANFLILWLNEYKYSYYTYTSYRSVAVKFYLWMKYNQLSLQTLDREHLLFYLNFLQSPPIELCGKRRKYGHSDWKPFRRALSASSAKLNITIIKQMAKYLFNHGYLTINPFKRSVKVFQQTLLPYHCLTIEELDAIMSYAYDLPSKTYIQKYTRVRIIWLIKLLYYTGCRRSELSKATMNDIQVNRHKVWLKVIGKGNKSGHIPIPAHLFKAFCEYRKIYQLSEIFERKSLEDSIPLIFLSNPGEKMKSVTDDWIYQNIRSICHKASKLAKNKNISHRLKQVSPHWFRHTAATHQVEAGVNIRTVQQNLRHSSIETTMRYIKEVNSIKRHQETIKKFGL